MEVPVIHLLLHARARAVGRAARSTLPPPSTTPPSTTPPPTTTAVYDPCPDGYSECSLGGCCSSEFGAWSSMMLSFLGIVLVLVCCSCWKYVVHARSSRSPPLLSRRPRTRRLSETSSAFPSSAPSPSVRVSWHGEPPPVLPDEPPPLYQSSVAVIPVAPTRDAMPTAPSLPPQLQPPPATSAAATTPWGRFSGQ